VHVSAPASSANLGPGFDCLGIALDLPFELVAADPAEGYLVAEPRHPARVAFVAAGGDPDAELHWRSPIPPGRGLGFSGAARVAGAYLAGVLDGLDHESARRGAFVVASELEGHPDNAGASAHGGFTVSVDDQVVGLALPEGVEVLAWFPAEGTSTDASRKVLSDRVARADVAHSVGRAALWVAAVASGDLGLLRTACQDRLHQPERLAARPDSAATLERLLAEPAVLAAWLSGSGPTVAALVARDADHAPLLEVLSHTGRARLLEVCRKGVGPWQVGGERSPEGDAA
jgi:homoserine kinase